MSQFFNSLKEVNKNYSRYDDWEQRQADERAKKEWLSQNVDIPKDKLELTKNKAEAVVRATEIMDARSEDNCEDMEQYYGFLSIFPAIAIIAAQAPLIKFFDKKISKKFENKINKLKDQQIGQEELLKKLKIINEKKYKISAKLPIYVSLGVILASLLSAVGMTLYSNAKQKQASRIGRFQAKQNELKDLKNFVIYTPEQLAKAEEIAKNIPDEKERNSFAKIVKELKNIQKDKKAYKNWLKSKDPEEIEKLKKLELSPEQLKIGEEDKELIVDAVKEINIKAEEYSENIENAYDTLGTLSWLVAAPIGMLLNKILKLCKVSPKINTAVSLCVPTLTALGISLSGTVVQKKAARVGRFKAREEILQNPSRLLAFSKEEMEKAEDIKAPKQKQGFFKKIGQSFSFIAKYQKDSKEYSIYRKETHKQNEKLYKALNQLEITDKQKVDAERLQKNVFRAFDEVDEMSQRYSEDIEAGCDIAKQLAGTIWNIGSLLGTALLTASIMKGKFPISKIINKLTNMTFKKESSIRKSVNTVYDVLKSKDKKVVTEFQKSFFNGDFSYFLNKSSNKDLKDAITPLLGELEKLSNEGVAASEGKNLGAALSNLLKEHFKQSAHAICFRKV